MTGSPRMARMVDSVRASPAENRSEFEDDLKRIFPSHLELVLIQLAILIRTDFDSGHFADDTYNDLYVPMD